MTVTARVYRRWCRPPDGPVDAHRRRQLAELVDRYGVTDARPATAVELDSRGAVELDGPPIAGEVLL